MSDDRVATSHPPPGDNGEPPTDFSTLRRLLVGPEQQRLEELAEELRARELTPAELAEHLPEAIMLRGQRDRQIGRALAPTVETALRESIRRNPREIATAIFPVLGPAIRKAIAETMSALVRSINSAVEHSFTPRGIRWRVESWRTGVPYAQIVIKHALVYRVEQAFLIHAETGLLLCHVTAPELKVPDADLISGMLTAIQDFVRDSFRPGEGATLRTFSVGDHTVQVEAGPQALLALVIRGEAPETVLRRQQDTLETAHVQYATQLSEYAGDASAFEAARPLLEECLETVVDTRQTGARRFGWLTWAIPLAVVLLVLLAASARARGRFDRGVAAIDGEPGLVVVNAGRRWGAWRIDGLRDPDAREPGEVLAAAGLMPRALSGRWDSYLSLDSAVVVARARRAYGLASAGMTLRAETLSVAGEVPLAALGTFATRPAVAGVARLSLEAATIVLPTALDSARSGIERSRILFDPGSAALSAGEFTRARTMAAQIRSLMDAVGSAAGSVVVSLVGRTDPTGTDETNQALSQWRVERVMAIFAQAGLPAAAMRQEAVATSRPLVSPDPREQARINRSVSFEITVAARSSPPREP